MQFTLLNQNISFDKAAEFIKEFNSEAGTVVCASTKANESKIVIRTKKPAAAGLEETILTVPLNGKPYRIGMGLVIPGPEPRASREERTFATDEPELGGSRVHHMIVIGGPEPSQEKTDSGDAEAHHILLAAESGDWHIEPKCDSLDISLVGRPTE